MKYTLLITLSFLFGSPLHSKAGSFVESKISVCYMDTSKYAIFKYDKRLYANYHFGKDVKPTSLSDSEIKDIEEIIRVEALLYTKKEQANAISVTKRTRKILKDTSYIYRGGILDSTSYYYKQFLPVVKPNGEKEVYISCFCSSDQKSHWKDFIIGVDGGGSCFFQLRINLTKRKVLYFEVNDSL